MPIEGAIAPFLDPLRLLMFHAMRAYGLHPLTQRGISRVNRGVNRAARLLLGHRSFTIKARDGRRFTVDPYEKQYQMGLLGLGLFEPASTATAAGWVREGDVVLDIGANFGWYSTLLSRLVGGPGQVHSFEPLPSTFRTLESNCRLNACANVTLNGCALGKAEGEADLNYFPEMAHGNTSMFAAPGQRSVKTRVPIATLDGYFEKNRLRRCDFIKCDAEGNEKAIIEGGAAVFGAHHPTVLIELSQNTSRLAGHQPREVLQAIARHGGYRFFRVLPESGYSEIQEPARLELGGAADYFDVLCVSAKTGRRGPGIAG